MSAGVETVAGNAVLVHHRRAVAATLAKRTFSSPVQTAVAVSKNLMRAKCMSLPESCQIACVFWRNAACPTSCQAGSC